MLGNSFGKFFIVMMFGESYGIVIGGVVDGCFLGFEIIEEDFQVDLDRCKFGIFCYIMV